MRKLLLALLLLFSLCGSASHLVGGNIAWKCVGSNQYIFTLNLYRDCGSGSATLPASEVIRSPFGAIAVNRDTIIDMTIPCNGDSTMGCNNATYRSIEHYRYTSAPFTITGTPPAAGWGFSYELCCRTASVVNLVNASSSGMAIKSVMYKADCNSSPYYDFNPSQQIISINNSLSTLAQSDNASDSLYYDFSAPKGDSTRGVTIAPNYSTSSPFPSTATDSLNGNVSINHSNGLIDFDVKVGANGLYAYSVVVEQWRDGMLWSKVFVENSVQGNFDTTSNNAPVATIDTALYDLQREGNIYRKHVMIGDTVEFTIKGLDSDINSLTNQSQEITFQAAGYGLGQLWNDSNSFVQDAMITPVATQSGFVSTNINEVEFKWVIGSEHCNSESNKHIFHFQFADDQCPYVGMSHIIFELEVSRHAFIKEDTILACMADTVQLNGVTASGKYLWQPSGDTIPNPKVATASSAFFVLQDPLNPGYHDSVFIVGKKAFDLTMNGSLLTLADSNNAINKTWYYNGIPLGHAYDTLNERGTGTYWVTGEIGLCSLVSDTITINGGSTFSTTSPSNGSYQGTITTVFGSLGVTFSLDDPTNLLTVKLPGITNKKKSTAYNFNMRLYDKNQNAMYNLDTVLATPFDNFLEIKLGEYLDAGEEYTLAVSGGGSYGFKVFEGATYPSQPYANGLTVLGAYEGVYKQCPTQPSTFLLPFVLETDGSHVLLDEVTSSAIEVYPNPVAESFVINGTAGATTIQLLDIQGRVIETYHSTEKSLEVKRNNLPSGVYFVKIEDSNTTTIKKVFFK